MANEDLFTSAPIPGMSLTGAPRNVPWENPPMLASVEDAIAYYTDKLLDPDTEDVILETLDSGVDIETAADYIITSSTMNGIHSLDVGFLINPVVRELLMLVADSTDTTYVESYKEQDKGNRVPRSMAKQIVRSIGSMPEQTPEMPEEQTIPPAYRGLMAPTTNTMR
jgi:hypothetical protein